MKFQELPEGYYFITSSNQFTVYVQKLENPESMPSYVLELDTIKVVHDGRSYNNKGGLFPKQLDGMDVEYKTFDEVKKERKSRGARISHITRHLNTNERLTGKTLELALDIIGDGNSGDPFFDGIAKKLIAGETLSEYEHHMMVDVRLLHVRLS